MNYFNDKFHQLFGLSQDAMDEKEVIDGIIKGVNFRGAKLWILVIAVFVASLGLNTNSAAVIIGAMLISPLMGPIIGMGLASGIYDFDLLRRSFRNYIISTLFSVLTATFYFLITPVAEAQSELLARTSPTIYDVLIALCGGLAGIVALSSRSQRTGNVIPGVAIATALMPPLCTVGFGIATANWTYALGALYLFVINTIFIAFATLIGTVFIMKFHKKTYIDLDSQKRVKRIIYSIVLLTIIPSVLLTIGMVRESTFKARVNTFIQNEFDFDMTKVISHKCDFEHDSFSVVLIGEELDSATINHARKQLDHYNLADVKMEIVQGINSSQNETIRQMMKLRNSEKDNSEAIIARQQIVTTELERKLKPHTELASLSPQLIREMSALLPNVDDITLSHGTKAMPDSTCEQTIAIVHCRSVIKNDEKTKVTNWIRERLADSTVCVIYN